MVKLVAQPKQPNSPIYGDRMAMAFDRQGERYTQFCMWASANKFGPIEYLLPQIQVETNIQPFTFERRFAANNMTPPTADEVQALGPWYYQVEFGPQSTVGARADEWAFHRYRGNMLVGLAAEIAGDKRSQMSVVDVACHCGVFALEFAELGFGDVLGVDLRQDNIDQGKFFARTFDVPNTRFETGNARQVGMGEPADITFCGGLIYHVTFPMELFAGLYQRTKEFAIVDTIAQKHPFSGFHIVCGKDVNSTIEGETAHEFCPTYRGVIDGLKAVGFEEVYEIIGDRAKDVTLYKNTDVRSFLAVKNRNGVFAAFRDRMQKVG